MSRALYRLVVSLLMMVVTAVAVVIRLHAALSRVLEMDGCEGTATTPWYPELPLYVPCVRYAGCPAAYPIVFCTAIFGRESDGHAVAVAGSKLFFDEASGAGAAAAGAPPDAD